jgi:hypothetical protein
MAVADGARPHDAKHDAALPAHRSELVGEPDIIADNRAGGEVELPLPQPHPKVRANVIPSPLRSESLHGVARRAPAQELERFRLAIAVDVRVL